MHKLATRFIRLSAMIVLSGLSAALPAQVKARDNSRADFNNATFQRADRTINGRVVDEKNEALPGVNVVLKGTQRGTTTDANGQFHLNVPDTDQPLLVFSFLGYLNQEISLGNQAQLNVVMKADTRALSEVVVVGYGTQRKKDLTGSVAQVDPTKLEGLPLTDVSQALQGQVAGVKVRRNGGEPGGEFSVFIRGVNTASGSSQPLYVVDGVPLASGSLNTLNPDEVQSIDVLKDASASAIYGSRAANGVVIITTKMAKKGQPTRVSFDAERGVQKAILPFKMMDSFEMAALAKESYAEAGLSIPSELNDPAFLANNNNNWLELGTRLATTSKYNLQVTGASDKTQFMVGASYLDNQGVIVATYNKNATLRVNVDHQVNDKFKIGTRIAGGYNNGTDFVTGNLYGNWRNATYTPPWIPGKNADGTYPAIRRAGLYAGGITDNPIAVLENANRFTTQYSFTGNLFGEYEVIKHLKLKYLGGIEYFSNRLYDLDPIYDRGDYNSPVVNVTDNLANTLNWLSDLTLTYDRTIGPHHITALGGMSAQKFNVRTVNVVGNGATSNALDQLSGQLTYSVSGLPTITGLYSYFGRAFYAFRDRYLLTATVRRDGSSRFGPENKWGVFPSASVGWIMSDEPFLKNVRWVSNVKLRASYGLTGNQDIPAYRYVGLVGVTNYANGNALAPGFSVGNPPNPAIRWESQIQTDIGFDLGLFNNRLTFTADYYQKTSDGLLTNLQLAPSVGFTGNLTKNVGTLSNKGWELAINSVNTTGRVKWNTSVNFSRNKNKVVDLGLDNKGNPVRLSGLTLGVPIGTVANLTTAGQPISSFYGYIWDGIYQANEADAAKAINPLLRPGDIKYRDLNNDGKIDANDRTFLGSPFPAFYGGITNTLSYKGLTLSVFGDFATGHSILNVQRMFGESGPFDLWATKDMVNRYRVDQPSNQYPRATKSTQTWNSQVSSNFVEKGDFFRLSNVTLAYQIPKLLTDKLTLNLVTVSISGNNLHTWTAYRGWNPETSTRTEPLSQGLDIGAYPLNRSFIGRISLTF